MLVDGEQVHVEGDVELLRLAHVRAMRLHGTGFEGTAEVRLEDSRRELGRRAVDLLTYLGHRLPLVLVAVGLVVVGSALFFTWRSANPSPPPSAFQYPEFDHNHEIA